MVNVTVRLSKEKNRLFNINTAADGITKQAVLEKAVDVFNEMHSKDPRLRLRMEDDHPAP